MTLHPDSVLSAVAEYLFVSAISAIPWSNGIVFSPTMAVFDPADNSTMPGPRQVVLILVDTDLIKVHSHVPAIPRCQDYFLP